MHKINKVVLLLGGNLGNRFENMRQAEESVSKRIGPIVQKSEIYETQSWGFDDKRYFLNRVVVVETDKEKMEVLSIIQAIEIECGRIRNAVRWGSRSMDIDILFFNTEIIRTDNLIIPHEQIPNRRFTLIPLMEIMPKFIHPELQMTIKELFEGCPDKSVVKKIKSEGISI